MFLFYTTRSGVAAKEVERQLGVTYKTAWRMYYEIRKYMATIDGDYTLGGFTKQVEVDETYIGGREPSAFGGKGKAFVLGMLERGGNVATQVVSSRRRDTLLPIIKDTVRPYSLVHTDEHSAYQTPPQTSEFDRC